MNAPVLSWCCLQCSCEWFSAQQPENSNTDGKLGLLTGVPPHPTFGTIARSRNADCGPYSDVFGRPTGSYSRRESYRTGEAWWESKVSQSPLSTGRMVKNWGFLKSFEHWEAWEAWCIFWQASSYFWQGQGYFWQGQGYFWPAQSTFGYFWPASSYSELLLAGSAQIMAGSELF